METSYQLQWQSLSTTFVNDEWVYQQIDNRKEDFNVAECIKDLTTHVWKVYACSPLFRYTLDEPSMEKLGEDLKQTLRKENVKCSECVVKFVPFLAFIENDDTAVQITVTVEGKVCEVLLISRGTPCSRNRMFINLPAVLCRGSLKAINPVIRCLEKLCDCSITFVTFTAKELLSMLLIGLKNGTFSNDTNVELKFKCNDLNDVSVLYNVNQEDMLALWKSISDLQDRDPSSNEKISLLYTELLTHYRRVYGIDLSYFTLKTVKFDNNVINLKGMVKLKVPEVFDFLLRHLTQRIIYEKRI